VYLLGRPALQPKQAGRLGSNPPASYGATVREGGRVLRESVCKCAGVLCVGTSEHGLIGSAIAPRYRSGVLERLRRNLFQVLTVSCPNRNAMLTSSGTDLTFILRIIRPR
jgi:hypothetical protein